MRCSFELARKSHRMPLGSTLVKWVRTPPAHAENSLQNSSMAIRSVAELGSARPRNSATSQRKTSGDTQHDECRWNYKVLAPVVVGSSPTGSNTAMAAIRFTPDQLGGRSSVVEHVKRFITRCRRVEVLSYPRTEVRV